MSDTLTLTELDRAGIRASWYWLRLEFLDDNSVIAQPLEGGDWKELYTPAMTQRHVTAIRRVDGGRMIKLAESHLGGPMESSARVALEDAKELYATGRMKDAERRALDSLRYSVGECRAVYVQAAEVGPAGLS